MFAMRVDQRGAVAVAFQRYNLPDHNRVVTSRDQLLRHTLDPGQGIGQPRATALARSMLYISELVGVEGGEVLGQRALLGSE